MGASGLIDLHTHTTASDGSLSPSALMEAARTAGLHAIAITDHDTLAGYDEAAAAAGGAGPELICGIEISTRHRDERWPHGKTVHLLGYFLSGGPPAEFRGWLQALAEFRRDRNRRLAARLESVGVGITLEEVEAVGRHMAGRPHFARLLVAKGYASSIQEAFDVYLDEKGKAFVEHESPSLMEAIDLVVKAGGLASLAHPVRLGRRKGNEEEALIATLVGAGLGAIEVFHSDHNPPDVMRYLGLARRFGVALTGGSDYHGEAKPEVELGTGRRGNVSVPRRVLEGLRASFDATRGLVRTGTQ